ncbi:MAG: efflux transporter outer membrane subunit [Ferrovum sp.]|nr:efflux transporter outer membrane subunit [Ferrovum sp.]NDU86678.1 efflux transporter outer membrane subunit [Ferrovum sp.]
MRGSRLLLGLLLAAGISGCSLIPEYHRPDMPNTDSFKEDGVWRLVHPADAQPRGDWWTYYHDDRLDQLENTLGTDNMVIQEALARYDQATAFLTQENAQLYPEVNMTGNELTNRQSVNRPHRGNGQSNIYGNSAVGLGFVYEIDFWGAIRSAVTSAEASAAASKADIESARLSLEAMLASNYIKLRGLDAVLALLRFSIDSYDKELQMMQRRHDEGIVSGLDVARSQALLEQTKAELAKETGTRAIYEHAIAVLVGKVPSQFALAEDPLWTAHMQYPVVPAAIPSEVLQRRPDIAAAERRVVAANAEIGVARAAFYPTISLAALGGFQNTGYGQLISAPNSFWSLGPLAFFNIFDAGARQAAVDQATAKTRQVTAAYRQTVLTAFREVEDSLSQLHYLSEEDQHELLAVKAARHTYDLANNRYREGAVNYLDVIDAENVRLTTERAELNVQTARLQSSVDLVRAIGGSW